MAKAMTKSQVVGHLAEAAEISKKAARTVVEALRELAVKEAKAKGIFTIPDFGKLRKANRKARMGRNPMTGAPIKIPAKTVVRFRVSKSLKEAIVGKR
jgi:DNA-binding protein HU-beta